MATDYGMLQRFGSQPSLAQDLSRQNLAFSERQNQAEDRQNRLSQLARQDEMQGYQMRGLQRAEEAYPAQQAEAQRVAAEKQATDQRKLADEQRNELFTGVVNQLRSGVPKEQVYKFGHDLGIKYNIDPEKTESVLQQLNSDQDPQDLANIYEEMVNQKFAAEQRMKQRLAPAKAPASAVPYFTPIQTAEGVMAFNNRLGKMEPISVDGRSVVGSGSDPTLKRALSSAGASGKVSGETLTESQINLPQTVQEASDTVGLIDDLINHPGLKQAVGTSSLLGMQKIPGTSAHDFSIRLDQLKGKQFLQAFQSLKGGGQITEVEGKKATEAMSRMDNSSSEDEFIKASKEFQEIIKKGVERARKKAGQLQDKPSNVDLLLNKYK